MTAINAKIEILKIKIVYRRKLAILQYLRSENVREKSDFYIIIEKDIPSVSKKTNKIFLGKYIFISAI
jgi:hypothetical protein